MKVTGTLDATYTCNPTVTLPSPPSGLTPCQTQAVQDFINTTLASHENDHVNAFTSNYNGTVNLPLNFTVQDNSSQITIGLTNAINKEDQRRVGVANAASAKLDPFKANIPGLDCKD